jgi:flagellar biosynthesis protein FlhG
MRTIAITSGKGGVGKSTVSANLAIALGGLGRRVVLFDADLGLANLDLLLGVTPRHTLRHAVREGCPLLACLTPCPNGVRLVPGGSGVAELIDLPDAQLDSFLRQLIALEGDCDDLIFDTGAGIQRSVMRFLIAADEVLLVCTPDPASVMDAYATAKTLFSTRPEARIRVIVNQAEDEEHARAIFARLREIVARFLDRTIWYAGALRRDPCAIDAARRRIPLVIAFPRSRAADDLHAIARGLSLSPEAMGRTDGLLDRMRLAFGLGAGRAV